MMRSLWFRFGLRHRGEHLNDYTTVNVIADRACTAREIAEVAVRAARRQARSWGADLDGRVWA